MCSEQNILIDPWLHKGQQVESIPADAEFLCAYSMNIQIDSMGESAYARHTEIHSELWVENDFHRGVVVSVPKVSSANVTAALLLDYRFRSLIGFAFPDGFERAGLLNEAEFTSIISNIKAEFNRKREAARKSRTEIVDLADDLHLRPEPTGTGKDQWQANCPGTNHHLYIVASTNSFGCGYCKRKGGPDELRTFVEDRQARDKQRKEQS